MKIAILVASNFHVLGGEERFILDLAKALKADVIVPTFTESVIKTYDPERSVNIISLNKPLPPEPQRIISGTLLFSSLKLPGYDFYIAMDDMSLHYLQNTPNHLYYVVTPRKAYYDMYYDTISKLDPLKALIYSISLRIFSINDRYYVKKHVKNFASISNNVRNRVCKTYQRHAPVIYPPIHVSNFHYGDNHGYWLSVGRIDKWKRTSLQIEAFRRMPDKPLIIVGKVSPQYNNLVTNGPPNVSFLHNISESELINLYSHCEGFITTSFDEDFGISPLEAMASGKPVVATKEGGYLETVIDGHTGILVQPDVDEICDAVCKISANPSAYKNACIEQASKFDYKIFEKNINELLRSIT
jgi:glycosyltransferase involved in cell wall biosynthesis